MPIAMNRLYITFTLWLLSFGGLGVLAPSLDVVILGVIPLGLGFIALLMYWVLPSDAEVAQALEHQQSIL